MAIPMAESRISTPHSLDPRPNVRRAGSSRGSPRPAAALVLCIALPLSTVRAEDSKSAQVKEAVPQRGRRPHAADGRPCGGSPPRADPRRHRPPARPRRGEDRVERLAGQGAPRPQIAGRPHPGLRLRRGQPQQFRISSAGVDAQASSPATARTSSSAMSAVVGDRQSTALPLDAAGQVQQLVPRRPGQVQLEQRVERVGQLLDSDLDRHRGCRSLEHVFYTTRCADATQERITQDSSEISPSATTQRSDEGDVER